MTERVFNQTWAWKAPNGMILRFRRNTPYDVPEECAKYADDHGISKRIAAAGENKMLKGPAENK